MGTRFARLALFAALVIMLLFPAALSNPALAGGTGPLQSPTSQSGEDDEHEDLRDSDHNKVRDGLDKRLNRGQDTDVFPVVLSFNKALSQVDFDALVQQLGNFKVQYQYPSINAVAATLSGRQVRAASKLGLVETLEYDATMREVLDTAAPWSGVIKARADFGVTGNLDGQPTYSKDDAVVAIIDTGIDAKHVDLDGGKVICWKDIVGGRASPYDDRGHGTHVAGIVAGEGQGNAAYTGVAPGAALVGIKVLNGQGSGSLSQVMAGVQWAIDNKAACGIRVINMSLGLAGSSDGTDALSQLVNAAVAAGIVTVVAAGNEGPAAYSIGSPAAAASAVTVGSLADPGEGGFFLSYFSSRGPTADGRTKPDLASPGHRIMSARYGTTSSYISYSGTSMATPFVAGVVALMANANPGLSPAIAKSLLTSTAVDWGPSGPDPDYGAGRLDAYAAIKAAAGATTGTPPAVPGHTYVSGSLPGTGASGFHSINVTNSSYPIAVTVIMPTWNTTQFGAFMYNPSGAQVAFADTPTRQETITYRPTTTGTYKLEVRSYSGSGPYFADISAGLAPPDSIPPAAPTGLSVSVPISNGGVLDLSWNASTELDLAGYHVYRATTSGGPYTKVNSSLVSANTFASAGLTNGTTYFYAVTAVDTSGNESAGSAQVSGTPVDNRGPAISNVATTTAGTSATVSWVTDEAADSTVEYGTTPALGSVAADAALVTSHSLAVSGLAPATTYFYVVKSKDPAGNLSDSAAQTFTTLAPPGTIAGTVTDASTGIPVPGATVSDGTRSATTDASGAYTLASVPAGSYTVTASRTGYSSTSQTVSVVAGATATADFALSPVPTTGTITGKVTSASTGAPIAGARVTAGNRTVFTDAGGNYTISNLSPGTYRVEAETPGYRKVRRTVSLAAGATVVLDFSLPRK
ncbi:MAG: S8 family serine peptidase [Chloroflexi bacterium]|nr:S8 family serine peptidase [Chloroflexota bacterium]